MKYSVETTIDLPREKVFDLLADPKNRPMWQRGLQTAELLAGEEGLVGAKSRLIFGQGKRKMEMVETITERTPPECFTSAYEAKGVHNVVATRLVEVDADTTRLIGVNEFNFSGFMRVIGFLAQKAFPRQSRKYMQDFKAFAEQGTNVNA